MRFDSLRLVRNAAEPDGGFTCSPPGTDQKLHLYRSKFNTAWIDEFGLSPKIILDIGSYDGGDSIRFKQRFPNAQVISFEADPDRYAGVARNVGPFGIQAVNAAVCDRDGPVIWYQSHDSRFHDSKTGSQGSMYQHSAELGRRFDFIRQSTTPITVNGIRIDSFCHEAGIVDVDVAHIDVEGAEYEVVAGFGVVLPKLIFVEALPFNAWIGAKPTHELHLRLWSLGYLMVADLLNERLYVRADLAQCLY